ncbi:aflatoxin biosynthesis ketoreductase-like protein nor-1 [Cladochytrium replicatum]|nr:aflatoxin biosynthesis ketoreductase-like protein nor-1 [Cladochytrium replicatum]
MSSLIYLITGASRGIGFGLAETLLKRPGTTVIAGVRDPTKAAKALAALHVATGSRLITVKIDSASETDALDAVNELTTKHGITHIDVLIANAGTGSVDGHAMEITVKSMREYWEVNTLGPLLLFQATWPLLQKGSHPKFIAISTLAGSIGALDSFPISLPTGAYGSSKAALNYLVRKIQLDYKDKLIAVAIHPGAVATDMGLEVQGILSKRFGLEMPPISVETSVIGIMDKIDNATSPDSFKTMITYDGEALPW